jgi:hypothetical protein
MSFPSSKTFEYTPVPLTVKKQSKEENKQTKTAEKMNLVDLYINFIVLSLNIYKNPKGRVPPPPKKNFFLKDFVPYHPSSWKTRTDSLDSVK